MTSRKSGFLVTLRQRLMASAAFWGPSLSPAVSRLLGTPSLIGNWEDCSPSPYYLTGNWWSEISAVREFCSERLLGSPTGRVDRTLHSGYSILPKSAIPFEIDYSLLDKLSETLTIPGLDYSSIELLTLQYYYGRFWKDALIEAMRGSSPEVLTDLINRGNRLYESSGCSRSSLLRTPRGG